MGRAKPRAVAKAPAPSTRTRQAQARAAMDDLRAKRGALSRLAKALGLSPQAVHQWEVVPLDRVIAVERATGISREKLRPDHHGVPSAVR